MTTCFYIPPDHIQVVEVKYICYWCPLYGTRCGEMSLVVAPWITLGGSCTTRLKFHGIRTSRLAAGTCPVTLCLFKALLTSPLPAIRWVNSLVFILRGGKLLIVWSDTPGLLSAYKVTEPCSSSKPEGVECL